MASGAAPALDSSGEARRWRVRRRLLPAPLPWAAPAFACTSSAAGTEVAELAVASSHAASDKLSIRLAIGSIGRWLWKACSRRRRAPRTCTRCNPKLQQFHFCCTFANKEVHVHSGSYTRDSHADLLHVCLLEILAMGGRVFSHSSSSARQYFLIFLQNIPQRRVNVCYTALCMERPSPICTLAAEINQSVWWLWSWKQEKWPSVHMGRGNTGKLS